jgi:Protein of unknown function (DUF2510)
MSTTTTAPAGWYPNPLDAATQRWWDGVSWTEHVSPELAAVQKTVEATAPEPIPVTETARATLPSFDTLPSAGASYMPPVESTTPAHGGLVVPAIPSVPWAQGSVSHGGAGYPGTGYARIGNPGSPYQGNPASWSTTIQSPNTVWIWLLAFGPIITAVAVGVAQGVLLSIGMASVGAENTPPALGLLGVLIGLVPVWVFAGLDIRMLRERGYHTAGIRYMLIVPPLLYFAMRARKLKQDGVRSRGPEIALLIVIAVYIGNAIIGAIIAASMLAPLL